MLKKIGVYGWDCLQYKSRLAGFLGIKRRNVNQLYHDFYASPIFSCLRRSAGCRGGLLDLSMLNPMRAPLLYVACRVLRPTVIVETGVADGFSSSCILQALSDNKAGKLYSIDLPNQPGEEIKHQPGWLVAEQLKSRWELVIGNTKQTLLPLLKKVVLADIFIHDSDHNYDNVLFELNAALPYVSARGLLLADDITMNSAFHDFCQKNTLVSQTFYRYGLASKR